MYYKSGDDWEVQINDQSMYNRTIIERLYSKDD